MLKELLKEILDEELKRDKNKEILSDKICNKKEEISMDSYWLGKKVIIRTYSAGIFFGEIFMKSGEEIIVKNARRLYYWKTLNNGISLSEVANHGLDKSSKVCEKVSNIYLVAIELIECSQEAIKNIEAQNDYKA